MAVVTQEIQNLLEGIDATQKPHIRITRTSTIMVKLLKFDGSTSLAIIETTSWRQPQLKARTQLSIETSQEFAAAFKQLAHQSLSDYLKTSSSRR